MTQKAFGESPPISAQPPTPPSTAGMTTRVVKGSLWTLAGNVAPLFVSLVATPFTIRLLGAESYGVFILIGIIPAYLGFADFGMSMASTKFGSEAYASGDVHREGRLIRTAALIALSVCLPVATLLMIFSGQLIALFNVPPHLLPDAVLALRIASVTFVVNILCGIFNTPQLARLRMDLNTFVNASARILGLIATPIALYLGFGVVGAISVLLAASLLNLAGHLSLSRRTLPSLFEPTIDRAALRPLAKFGIGSVISGIASVMLVNLEKGVLAASVSPTSLAYYSVAFTLANMTTLFSLSMVQSLIPAFSQLQGREKSEQFRLLYSRAIRLSMAWVVPAMIFLALVAKPFLTLWAGADFGINSTLPFYLLLFGLFFNMLAYVPHSVILASGRTDLLARLYWIEIVPYVVIVWLLASRFNAAGAAAAWSLRVIVDTFAQFYFSHQVSRQPLPLGKIRFMLAAMLIMVLPAVGLLYFGEINIVLMAFALVCLVIYAVIIFRRTLDPVEREWIISRISARLPGIVII